MQNQKTVLKKLNANYRRKGILLLVLYLTILASSILHVHIHEQESIACQDCIAQVKHNGHITQSSTMDYDCVLCKFFQTSYTTPQVLTISATALVIISIAILPIREVAYRNVALPSLRAPPALAI